LTAIIVTPGRKLHPRSRH